eukprot:gnl/TRDRNA2_/TRDRNA2_113834_c0_seq2.p1 gnl/TRDRNA2_/TRDRNA2_113834_c0~~gnl/TRDRNA2_/TRDRNA2_113834_c0_seq2.p1  ORF type:complete len:118 (-),score=18.23 gnl/TRDRNA2_/TRDRNA2_113834_c0_seq2:132-485(-)
MATSSGTAGGKRDRLLETGAKLDHARNQILDTQRNALQAEETGFAVLSDLARQRETIDRVRNNALQVDENTSGARRTLTQMNRRNTIKKVVLWAAAIAVGTLLIVVIWIVYLKKLFK